jgi:hypothetical protein
MSRTGFEQTSNFGSPAASPIGFSALALVKNVQGKQNFRIACDNRTKFPAARGDRARLQLQRGRPRRPNRAARQAS